MLKSRGVAKSFYSMQEALTGDDVEYAYLKVVPLKRFKKQPI